MRRSRAHALPEPVADSTGAVIAGAQVTIKNTANGFSRELVTNDQAFTARRICRPALTAVTVSAKGFKSEVRTGLTLTVGADVEVNLTLAIGNASESVDVQGEPPAVETNDATLSGDCERPDDS